MEDGLDAGDGVGGRVVKLPGGGVEGADLLLNLDEGFVELVLSAQVVFREELQVGAVAGLAYRQAAHAQQQYEAG